MKSKKLPALRVIDEYSLVERHCVRRFQMSPLLSFSGHPTFHTGFGGENVRHAHVDEIFKLPVLVLSVDLVEEKKRAPFTPFRVHLETRKIEILNMRAYQYVKHNLKYLSIYINSEHPLLYFSCHYSVKVLRGHVQLATGTSSPQPGSARSGSVRHGVHRKTVGGSYGRGVLRNLGISVQSSCYFSFVSNIQHITHALYCVSLHLPGDQEAAPSRKPQQRHCCFKAPTAVVFFF